ncbi:MAG: sulfatase-like hydrolase/transferase [Verrucomicrobiota bacterium]
MKRTALIVFTLALPLWGNAFDDRPNIILFISDDMGWNDVGYHGATVETPHLDQLVAEGLELDRFYVHPICSPTRAALMTGKLPVCFGITGPLSNSGDRGLPVDETLLSDVFREAGYDTALIGKWHLGSGESFHPNARGFDHFYGHLGGMIDYYEHSHAGRLDWQRNGISLEEYGYSTDLIAEEAVQFLGSRDPAVPLLLVVPFNAPHGPPQAPEELVEKYEAKGQSGQTATRSASIDSMDQAIGAILDAVQSEGMEENSIVLFFCDNGAKGSKRGSDLSDGGLALRGGKSDVFEGGIRVPAVMRWPKEIAAGKKSDAFVSVLDLLPTLTAAAGIAHESEGKLDGINRWPALSGGETDRTEPILIVGQRGSSVVLDEPLKLVQKDGETFLYDVVADPFESNDLAPARPGEVERLQAYLEPISNLGRRSKKGANRGEKGKSKKRPRTES